MPEQLSPLAGKPAPASLLVDIPRLITAYFTGKPDPAIATQRVAFGTSGHRGSSFETAFNENHILAISQAICNYRHAQRINGPLFIGIDTHALSAPALASAIEVFVANDVDIMIDQGAGYTPTPVISHAILAYNRGRSTGLADGIVITPSHNPPRDGGFKYNPPNGGPADTDITSSIEQAANAFLAANLNGVRRVQYDRAQKSALVHRHDYVTPYVSDLAAVIDMDAIRASGLRIGIDPLGGASIGFWQPIIEAYGITATIVNDSIDPTFRFMPVDWDGQIRMDCSSPYAMAGLIAMQEQFDIAFANDTDADRHGIVTASGLMNPNHYLAASISYLFQNRPKWGGDCAVGKTMVSSGIIDRVTARLGRRLFEVPVGFKWFSGGLLDGSLGFGGEESAGASFLRRDGTVWSTDKDGLILGLLAAEMTAKGKHDPAVAFAALTEHLGMPYYERIDAPAAQTQKQALKSISPDQLDMTELAGSPVRAMLTAAPGNGAPFGGIKVVAENGWFAARPSGTENVFKIYAESFVDAAHLRLIQTQAEAAISSVLGRS